jgi:hypothetical protein
MPRDLTEDQTANIRSWLQQVMRKHGYGYGDIYTITGIREGTLRRLLHDDTPTPRIQKATVAKIARGFRLDPGQLFDHADGNIELPVPDILNHQPGETLEQQVDQLRAEVNELRQTLAQIVDRLES